MANVLETSMNFLQTQDPEIAACAGSAAASS